MAIHALDERWRTHQSRRFMNAVFLRTHKSRISTECVLGHLNDIDQLKSNITKHTCICTLSGGRSGGAASLMASATKMLYVCLTTNIRKQRTAWSNNARLEACASCRVIYQTLTALFLMRHQSGIALNEEGAARSCGVREGSAVAFTLYCALVLCNLIIIRVQSNSSHQERN